MTYVKYISGRRVCDAGRSGQEPCFLLRIEQCDVNLTRVTLFAQVQIQKVSAIGQKMRPAVTRIRNQGGDWYDRAATCGHAIERSLYVWTEEDHTIAAPSPAAAIGSLAKCLGW